MRTFIGIMLAGALMGCSPVRPSDSSIVRSCQGQLTFIVTNRSNRDVDVLAYVNGSAQALGTVRAGGNEELLLPRGASGAYTRAVSEGGTVRTRGTVDTRYSCRP
jgi:hypothetical protein